MKVHWILWYYILVLTVNVMGNKLDFNWFIRVSSTVDFEKENSMCIIVVNFIQCFSDLGINKFLSLDFDYQSILILKRTKFWSLFFITENRIYIELFYSLLISGRVTKCYQWCRRLIALSFRPSQILSFGFNLKYQCMFIYSGPGISMMC